MNSIKQIFFIIVLALTSTYCTKPQDVKYSFFLAGHTYGKPGTTDLGLYKLFKDKFELINSINTLKFGVLTGDIVRHASAKSWDVVDTDLKELNVPVHLVRGNHDGALSFYEKRYGKTYKHFIVEGDSHIILDSNIGKWNIVDEQLQFLKQAIENNPTGNIFIYVHHIIWWNETEYYAPYMNSRDFKSDTLTFWTELYPILKATQKPVFLFAGDVGAFDHKNPKYQSYSYVKKDNLTFITSGMGGGKKDNFVIANVNNNNQVSFNLIQLNGDNINGLGKLEDYNNN